MSFYLMQFLKTLFLVETDFCNAGVIQGLVQNLVLYLVILLDGACLLMILPMESKTFWNDASMLLL